VGSSVQQWLWHPCTNTPLSYSLYSPVIWKTLLIFQSKSVSTELTWQTPQGVKQALRDSLHFCDLGRDVSAGGQGKVELYQHHFEPISSASCSSIALSSRWTITFWCQKQSPSNQEKVQLDSVELNHCSEFAARYSNNPFHRLANKTELVFSNGFVLKV